MKAKFLLSLLIIGGGLSLNSAFAAESTLGSCMVDSMTGKERKEMAQWIFFAIAAHPEIKEYSNVPEAIKNTTDMHMAKLVTRLLTEDCLAQAKAAVKQEGNAAIVGAFELVGKVAMQELMRSNEVSNSIGAYAKYLDQEKLKSISSEK